MLLALLLQNAAFGPLATRCYRSKPSTRARGLYRPGNDKGPSQRRKLPGRGEVPPPAPPPAPRLRLRPPASAHPRKRAPVERLSPAPFSQQSPPKRRRCTCEKLAGSLERSSPRETAVGASAAPPQRIARSACSWARRRRRDESAMASISALVFVDSKGKPVLSRDYRCVSTSRRRALRLLTLHRDRRPRTLAVWRRAPSPAPAWGWGERRQPKGTRRLRRCASGACPLRLPFRPTLALFFSGPPPGSDTSGRLSLASLLVFS